MSALRREAAMRAALALFVGLLGAADVRAHDTIVAEGVVDAPVAAVWSAWTTSDGLRGWLAPHADIDLRIGGSMRTQYSATGTLGDAGTIENRILAFDPERMLTLRVARAPDSFPFKAEVPAMWTVLYFDATADGRTRLRIVGLGFPPDEASQRMKAFFERGNAYTLAQLQKRFLR